MSEKTEVFKSISLSWRTVADRIMKMAKDVEDQQKIKLIKLISYSLAIDEITDKKDTMQLAIFIRSMDSELNISEDFLDFVTLRGNKVKMIFSKLSF